MQRQFAEQKIDPAIIKKNAQFETTLAIMSCTIPNLFPVFDKVASVICQIILDHKPKIIEILNSTPPEKKQTVLSLLTENLYGDFCPLPRLVNPTPEQVLAQIIATLKDNQVCHAQKMPLLGTFNYQILRLLFPDIYKSSEVFFEKVENILYGKDQSGRKVKRGIAEIRDIEKTYVLGICHDEGFLQELSKLKPVKYLLSLNPEKHLSSIGRFIPEKELLQLYGESPLVAGPSSHTFSMFSSLLTYEKLNLLSLTEREKHQLAVAYAMYLVAAGYHSLDSVMVMAEVCIALLHYPEKLKSKKTNQFPQTLAELIECINYKMAHYVDKIPLNLRGAVYDSLCHRYPQQMGQKSPLRQLSLVTKKAELSAVAAEITPQVKRQLGK